MTTQTLSSWRPADTLGARLVLVRKELGLSQRAAALKAGVSFGTWQGMEDGRGTRNVHEVALKISDSLGVDRDWLLWGGALGTAKRALWSPFVGASLTTQVA